MPYCLYTVLNTHCLYVVLTGILKLAKNNFQNHRQQYNYNFKVLKSLLGNTIITRITKVEHLILKRAVRNIQMYSVNLTTLNILRVMEHYLMC